MTRSALRLALVALLLCACSTAGPSPSATPSPAPSPTPSPSPAAGFYLRAWYTQALPPRSTFGWLAMLTVSEGVLLDGNVAIDMIFPGPLVVLPVARPISDDGAAILIAEARRLGLLGGTSEFTNGQAAPGSRLGQLEMAIDGRHYLLTGDPDALARCGGTRCVPDPGTPEAFAAFWQELTVAGTWLEAELGPSQQYVPDRLALLLGAPASQAMPNVPATWPFDTPLAEAGVAFPGDPGDRCVTLSGDALAAIWPILRDGNQLTVFVDNAGTRAAALVRVLVPGDESPCPDAL